MKSSSNGTSASVRLVVFLFVILIVLDWAYVLWAKSVVGTLNSAWFALTPLFAYFYGFFGFFAAIGMYHKSKLALSVAYCVVLFGCVSVVLSYNVAYNIAFEDFPAVEFALIPLLLFNACVLLYIASKQRVFMAD